MEKTEKLRKMIKGLSEKIEEPELIKAITQIDSGIDEIDKEYDDLLQKHKDLKTDYSNYIKGQGFKGNNEEDKQETEEVNFEDLANQFLKEKGEEF